MIYNNLNKNNNINEYSNEIRTEKHKSPNIALIYDDYSIEYDDFLLGTYKKKNVWENIKTRLWSNQVNTITNNNEAFSAISVKNWNTNDTFLTRKEASIVTPEEFDGVFNGNTTVKNFNELKYFTGLNIISSSDDNETSKTSSPFRNSTIESVEIPEKTKIIGKRAFDFCTNLKTIGDVSNIEKVNRAAFQACSSLTEFNLSDKCKLIDDYAFYYCKKIESLGDLSNVEKIGDSALGLCSSLKEVNLTNKCTEISRYGFYNDRKLEIVGDISNIDAVNEFAFYSCSSLTSVNLSNKCTIIKSSAFDYCDSLEKVGDLSNVTEIDEYGFNSCYSLSGELSLDKTASIGYCGFQNCYNITKIKNANNLKKIDGYAFSKCTSLTEFDPPLSKLEELSPKSFQICTNLTDLGDISLVKKIETYSFIGCNKLSGLTGLEKVEEIESHAFVGCYNLKYDKLKFEKLIGVKHLGVGGINTNYFEIPETVKYLESASLCPYQKNTITAILKPITPPSYKYVKDLNGNTQESPIVTLSDVSVDYENSVVYVSYLNGPENYVSLYVPLGSIDSYKASEGFSGYTNINPIPDYYPLPSGYTELEYIENSGDSYVDTEWEISSNDTIECKFISNDNEQAVFGSRKSVNSNVFGVWSYGTDKLFPHYGNTSYNAYTMTGLTQPFEMVMNSSGCTVNKQFKEFTGAKSDFTNSGFNMTIFAFNKNGSIDDRRSKAKFYYFRIKNKDNNIVRAFIPCINPNGEVGFCDSANYKFYGSKTSTPFKAGPIIKKWMY